ncbi:MAG: YkgJ family cysteine cluster protein [Desulfurispora sp.]|uniref:YkgJ family cysteine cluster protein n=1 Tax=Desulfurispora sp. TaxID=3014275 RepID=UPI00404B295D
MLLALDKLYPQLSYAEKHGLFAELQQTYDRFPPTLCRQCARCCTVPPPAYVIEYLYMFNYLRQNLTHLLPDLVERAVKYFYLELLDINVVCPFVDPQSKLCLVYPVRPLTCRAYGLTRVRAGDDEREKELARLAGHYREKHGIEIPPEVLGFRLPECKQVKVLGGEKITPELQAVLLAEVASLESRLFGLDYSLVESGTTFEPLARHLALTVLPRGAVERRIKVMKEYLAGGGDSATLREIMGKARQFSL